MDWEIISETWLKLLPWVFGLAIIFSVLARYMACNPGQKILRNGLITDLIYFFLIPLFNRIFSFAFIATGTYFIFYGEPQESAYQYIKNGFGPVSHLPVWLQIALVFILSDILLYWIHRLFHTKDLWKFHAIHHSSETVDWLSTYRFHPVNTGFSFALVDTLMLLVGFAPSVGAAVAGFNILYSAMVHANLNWTFGPFKYAFASPVFHRWHHTTQKEGLDKNFAPTFPILDVIFGTFYMPEGKLPEKYGVADANIPHDFIGQLVWPFKVKL